MSEINVVKVIRSMRADVDGDRTVSVYLLDNGAFQLEWERPDEDQQSLVRYTSRVGLSAETFAVTAQVMHAMIGSLAEESGDEHEGDNFGLEPGFHPAAEDAERYRKWRDLVCYRPDDLAKALADCITPAQIDEALDRL